MVIDQRPYRKNVHLAKSRTNADAETARIILNVSTRAPLHRSVEQQVSVYATPPLE